jgi:hypothetical protein
MSHAEAHRHHRRVVAAGIAGNVMEWYDFSVYGFFAGQSAIFIFQLTTREARCSPPLRCSQWAS